MENKADKMLIGMKKFMINQLVMNMLIHMYN